MKVQKMISIDIEVARLLQEEKNASLLINGWARNYYNLDGRFVEPKKKVENIMPEKPYEKELKEEDLDAIFKQEVI